MPRGIIGPVFAMARPRRPREEAEAVAQAAELVRAETGVIAAEPTARVIARRVVAQLLAELDRDPFEAALASLELRSCPFRRLAVCETIDTASAFVEVRVERLRARGGRDLSPHEQMVERRQLADEVERVLAGRYGRHLRARS